jgi:hypothetical protein
VVAEPPPHLVDLGDVPEPRPVPELAHPAELALEVAVGLAEVLEADRSVVDGMERRQRVDQVLRDGPAGRRRAQHLRQLRAHHGTPDGLHQVEGGTDDRGIPAQRQGARDRHLGVGVRQRPHHPVLPGDVVGGRRKLAPGRPAQHHLPSLASQGEREAGLPLAESLDLKGSTEVGQGRLDEMAESVGVDQALFDRHSMPVWNLPLQPAEPMGSE